MSRRAQVAVVVAAAACVAPPAQAASQCGTVQYKRLGTYAENITATHVGCSTARKVSKRWLVKGYRFRGWHVSARNYVVTLRRGQARIRFLLVGTD